MKDKRILCKDIFALLFIVSLSVLSPLIQWGFNHWPQHRLLIDFLLGTDLSLMIFSFVQMLRWHNIGINVSRTGFLVIIVFVFINPFVVMALGFSLWPNFALTWGYVIIARLYSAFLERNR
jgi:hypothetical protein